MKQRTYICIDLKSFYASVECVDRQLDALTTNLVVADKSRTDKTICLAVSPALKSYGIPGRPRLFEVIQKVQEVNRQRRARAPGKQFSGSSYNFRELASDPRLELEYIVAPPRMNRYMEVSAQIYAVYLRYIAPEDIFVYSIDEVFIDLTTYLPFYRMSAHDLTMTLIREVLANTGITATAGIGSNLYLAKVAMDIVAKHKPADADGVRIAELDERNYRELLWAHEPLTDFWRVGHGYEAKLKTHGLHTMGDIARASLDPQGEDLLYRLFGVNAELLIDHAWGWEPTTMQQIKAYRPQSKSLGSGQVLHCPYDHIQARLVVREMIDLLVLDMVSKGFVTDQVTLTIGYDRESLSSGQYTGPVKNDYYGRRVPKHAHGTESLARYTRSTRKITEATLALYDRIIDDKLLVRRISVTVNHLVRETDIPESRTTEQLDFFTDYTKREEEEKAEQAVLNKEQKLQEATLAIKQRFGKNAILKGMNLQQAATARDRNAQVGGHKA